MDSHLGEVPECTPAMPLLSKAFQERRLFWGLFSALLIIATTHSVAFADPTSSQSNNAPMTETQLAQSSQAAATPDASNQIQEVVVNARLRKESLMQTPVVVTA